MQKILTSLVCCACLLLLLSACQKEYRGEYIEWGERANSNATELLKKNEIPYEVKDGMIYILEDAVEDAIFCCS